MPTSPKSPSTTLSQNPLTIRLYKVLAANFDDDATKEAFETLSELYAPGPSPASVKSKGKEVEREKVEAEDDKYDDADEEGGTAPAKAVHSDTGSFYEPVPGEIAANARRNLRRDVESKLAESSRRFLAAFAEVDKQLDTLQEHIGAMRARCDDAQTQLHETNEACRSLLDRAGSLREQRQEQDVTTRQSIVIAFLRRFTLSPNDVEAITSREVPVGRRFFTAMDKTEHIRDDCRVLMAGEDGPTKAGIDIVTTTSGYLEQAYDKIFRWCTFEFRQMGKDAQLDVDPAMQESVRRLKQRPELLTEALTLLAQTRQAALLSSFTAALTRGGPGGLPRPIELHAHDPLRYVGDMLAWVHQAIAAEREFLEGLFGMRAEEGRRMVGAVRAPGGSEEEEWMAELMDRIVGGLCTPLKTVRSQESSITSYKIANLLQFYLLTMQRTIGNEAVLSKALRDMTDYAHYVFFEAVEAQGRSLLRVQLELDDSSLTPPFVILDHVQILREILLVYDSSLGDELHDAAAEGCRAILDRMVDPAIEMCVVASEDKHKARPTWDREIFVINTMTYLQGVLQPFAFTVEKQSVIQGLVEGRIIQLIEDHVLLLPTPSNAYRNLTLSYCLLTDSSPFQEPLSHLPAASTGRLQAALHKFSVWLTSNTVDHPPRLAQLSVQSLASRVHRAALARLVKTYRWLCEEVRKPENKYEAAATVLGSERPFGQVHLLWQIFGIEEDPEDTAESNPGAKKVTGAVERV
ncbi:hypothetical protein PHLGIDRAFT_68807 [Phlebiopsis gigantea 11061_1 CR5-6]|uniref:Conserved oligomeric Golgi complex subunit 6 n=1 Tax=Phlebiopsis gigantea (strain 11061_1 CR5-6) TaxID=745531 RepID=A0A0C3SA06_PHLG1|nr:hypothetical protein PHLGIDRAFT_68807 [Phlebiopsis gigantea 11061_1 CR5-6]